MATADTVLFSWSDVEHLPELRRLELVLEALPDEELVSSLEAVRGRGRDDYPVRAMWRAVVVFGRRSTASLLRECGLRSGSQSGVARGVRIRGAASPGSYAPVRRAGRWGIAGGERVGSVPRFGSEPLELLAVRSPVGGTRRARGGVRGDDAAHGGTVA